MEAARGIFPEILFENSEE